MGLIFDSFWRAVAYCLHPRVIALSVLPLLLMVALSFALGYFFWEGAVASVAAWLASFELVEAFYALAPPTRLKLRNGIMNGTLEALTSGRADLAIGVSVAGTNVAGLQQELLGDLLFIYVVAPHHPLATAPEPITDATLLEHRAVAVADSAQRGGLTMGLLGGQDVLTVDTMQAKVQVQLRGLGGGFLPEPMVRPYVEAGHLVERKVARPARSIRMHYAWGGPGFTAPGRALQWWLSQLQSPTTRRALLENHHHF